MLLLLLVPSDGPAPIVYDVIAATNVSLRAASAVNVSLEPE